jgi:O-antigen ligase
MPKSGDANTGGNNLVTPKLTLPKLDWLALLFGGLALLLGGAATLAIPFLPHPLIVLAIPVALVVGLATFANSELGLLILIFITYTRFSDVLVKYQRLPSIADPLIGLLVVVLAVRLLLYGERPKGWGRAALVVLIFGLWCAMSLFYADNQRVAQNALIVYVKDIVVAVMAASVLQRLATLRRIVWILLAAGIFLGTLTVWQQVTRTFSNNYWGFAQGAAQNIVGQTSDFRASGSVGDPNFYAQIMVVLIPLAIDRFRHERSWWLRGLALYAAAVTALTIVFTYSRGGFVAMVVAAALMFTRRPPRVPLSILALAAVFILWPFVPAQYTARVTTIFNLIPGLGQADAAAEVSFRGRLSENAAAILMFQEHPITGVGLDNYKIIYQSYSRRLGLDDRLELRAPHSLYLQIASELGVVGLIIFGWILISLFGGLIQAQRDLVRYGQGEQAHLVFAFLAGLVGYLAAAVFLHSAYARFLWLLFAIGLTIPNVVKNELAILRQQGASAR